MIQLHLLNHLHLSFHCAPCTVFCSLHPSRCSACSAVPDSTGVIAVRQCLLPQVPVVLSPSTAPCVCVTVIWLSISAGTSTFMSVYCCFETSTVFGTFWLFLSVPLVAVWTFWLSRASSLGCLLHSVTDRTALDVLPQFSGSRHSTRSFCDTFCNRCLFPEFLN